MTATDELRRLLDERGVEWMDDSYARLWCTVWHGQDGKQWRMTENQSGMLTELKAWQVTPEQAVEATLGRGTCRDVCASVSEFTCSVCGFKCDLMSWISLFDGDEGRHRHHHHGTPNYCPNCGREVVNDQ